MLNELGVVVIVIYVSIAGFRVLRERKKSRMKMANLVRTTNRIANIKRKALNQQSGLDSRKKSNTVRETK